MLSYVCEGHGRRLGKGMRVSIGDPHAERERSGTWQGMWGLGLHESSRALGKAEDGVMFHVCSGRARGGILSARAREPRLSD
jgi:hypothetical protein